MFKIGYTTGVFDLFHVGHLNVLKNAKSKCDKLIVGVSSDELVYSYKNRYPIVPLNERLAIVEAISYVDEIVVQKNMDKLLAWEKYRFDVHFHGDDWKDSNLYTKLEADFKARGVESIFFPYTEGTSTSSLKKKIYTAMSKEIDTHIQDHEGR